MFWGRGLAFIALLLVIGCREHSNFDPSPSLFPLKINGKWRYINSAGSIVGEIKYEGLSFISESFGIAYNQETWSVIDQKGHLIVDKKIKDVAQPFFEGELVLVKVDFTWCYMNRKGEIVWKNMPSPYSETQWSIPTS